MSFFVVRGKQITLMQGVRKPGGSVRHLKLYAFRTRQALAESLEPDAWTRFQQEMATRFPDLNFDWARLRTQGQKLVSEEPKPEPASPDEQVLKLRRAIKTLNGELQGLGRLEAGSPGRELLLRAGHDLRDVVYAGASLLDRLVEPPSEQKKFQPSRWYPLLFPDEEVDHLVDCARKAWESGDRKKGRKLFQQAQERLPFQADPINTEGICHLEDGDLDQACRLFERAAELARHQLPLGRRSFDWGELEVRPYVRALHNLGLALERQGKLPQAIEAWEKCLQVCPGRDGLSLLIGAAYHRQGQLSQAVQWYQRNLDSTPDERYNLAAAHLSLGKLELGVEDLLWALPLNLYVPSILLEDHVPESSVHHYWQPEDVDWADCYAEQHRELWRGQPLRVLKVVWDDPAVREACNELQATRRALNLETDRERRGQLAEQLYSRNKGLLGRPTTRELVARVRRALAR